MDFQESMLLNLLNCHETETKIINGDQVQLILDPITDKEYPRISVVTPTYNRSGFVDFMIRNWKKIDYPKTKVECIIVDESPNVDTKIAFEEAMDKHGLSYEKDAIKYVKLDQHLKLGRKRNFLGCIAKMFDEFP